MGEKERRTINRIGGDLKISSVRIFCPTKSSDSSGGTLIKTIEGVTAVVVVVVVAVVVTTLAYPLDNEGEWSKTDEPQKFASVHKVFGASNVNKMLQELAEHQRRDAVSSMVYEANARVRDPVYGCVGAISSLQKQIDSLQTQLALAQAEVVHMRMRQFSTSSSPGAMDRAVDQAAMGESLWSC
ncbi:hypothetical protein OIU76_024762 [Salix suchowensis]|nr:hypothetical protein OIU76_024762 [Salix suchowensis]